MAAAMAGAVSGRVFAPRCSKCEAVSIRTSGCQRETQGPSFLTVRGGFQFSYGGQDFVRQGDDRHRRRGGGGVGGGGGGGECVSSICSGEEKQVRLWSFFTGTVLRATGSDEVNDTSSLDSSSRSRVGVGGGGRAGKAMACVKASSTSPLWVPSPSPYPSPGTSPEMFILNGNIDGFREEEEGEVLLECRDVYKSFGDKHVLRGASFKVRHGEAVGIIGPSGTGKSTILRILAGLLGPDKGDVYVCGKKRTGLIGDNDNTDLRIGMVFQSAALFDSLTVRENVGFMLYEHSNLPEERIRELVEESLASVGLKDVEERVPSELSGGMKKRVALARAIISDGAKRDREVVMYDEPTAGLDPIASTVVEDLIRSLHINGRDVNGKTGRIASYVVVTHQHSTIRRAVDRLIFLHDGRVVWEGLTHEFDSTSEAIVRQFAEGTLNGPIKY